MKKIEVSEDVYEALKGMTTDFHQSPNDVLAALFNVGVTPNAAEEPLVGSSWVRIPHEVHRCRQVPGDTRLDRRQARVGVQRIHPFLSASQSGRRYLGLSREAIVEQCRHNQARQIPSTHYWAIMNIDTATKRRFLSRVLEFIGYREDVVTLSAGQ